MRLEPTPNSLLSIRPVVSGRGKRKGILDAGELNPNPSHLSKGHSVFADLPGHGPSCTLMRHGSYASYTEQGRENPDDHTHYWMTSSARASTAGGIVRPRAFAVFRLITNSNLVGCSMGRSAGFAPLRMLSTYLAARRNRSGSLGA